MQFKFPCVWWSCHCGGCEMLKNTLKSLSGAGVQYGVIWIPLNPPPKSIPVMCARSCCTVQELIKFIVITDICSDKWKYTRSNMDVFFFLCVSRSPTWRMTRTGTQLSSTTGRALFQKTTSTCGHTRKHARKPSNMRVFSPSRSHTNASHIQRRPVRTPHQRAWAARGAFLFCFGHLHSGIRQPPPEGHTH